MWLEYMIEVVQYWQERAKQLEALILQLTPEKIGELVCCVPKILHHIAIQNQIGIPDRIVVE